jgi:RNA recognition motif-containing protein
LSCPFGAPALAAAATRGPQNRKVVNLRLRSLRRAMPSKCLTFDQHALEGFENLNTKWLLIVRSQNPQDMENPGCSKLFVRGFPTDAEEADIAQYFETWGKVIRVDIKKDYNSNESRGFGFVTMASSDEFRKVIDHPEPHKIGGNELIVKEAKESTILHHFDSRIILVVQNKIRNQDICKMIDCLVFFLAHKIKMY